MTTICGVLLLLLASSLAAGPGKAQENSAQPQRPRGALPSDLPKNCPPGHRIEFVLPATTLFVDVRWLGPREIIHLFDMYGVNCPSGPIKLGSLELGYGVIRALDIRTGLGRGILRLNVGGDPSSRNKPSSAPAGEDNHPPQAAPWIEDRLLKPPLKGLFGPGTKSPDTRSYRLHYPNIGDRSDTTVDITCGGELGHRLCGTDHGYASDGVYAGYQLSQDQLPIPKGSQVTSTDPVTEPGALLQLDSRLRAWLRTLQQRP